MSAVESILLFAVGVGADAYIKKLIHKHRAHVQARETLRAVSVYRFVSEPAMIVIGGDTLVSLFLSNGKYDPPHYQLYANTMSTLGTRFDGSMVEWGQPLNLDALD